MSLKITIHSTAGTDLLAGKDGKDGLTVTFDDGIPTTPAYPQPTAPSIPRRLI